MGFKLGSEKRGFRIPGKSNSSFIGRKSSTPYKQGAGSHGDWMYGGDNEHWNDVDWSITDDDGEGYDNFDLSGSGNEWWMGESDPNEVPTGSSDASQVDGKARWSYDEPDDSVDGYGPDGDKDPAQHPQFRNKKYIIGAQFKWMPFMKGFGGPAGRKDNDVPPVTMQSFEQRTQKRIAEELYGIANRDAAPAATTAGVAAQGAHMEAAYHSEEFRNFVRKQIDDLISRGGDPSLLMIDDLHKWNSFAQIGGEGAHAPKSGDYSQSALGDDGYQKSDFKRMYNNWREGRARRKGKIKPGESF